MQCKHSVQHEVLYLHIALGLHIKKCFVLILLYVGFKGCFLQEGSSGGHFSDAQETTIIYMVSANSALKLRESQNRVL